MNPRFHLRRPRQRVRAIALARPRNALPMLLLFAAALAAITFFWLGAAQAQDQGAAVDAVRERIEVALEAGRRGAHELAIRELTKVIESQGLSGHDQGMAFKARAINWFDLSQFDKAVADFTEAMQRLPNDPDVIFNRGGAYQKIGREDLARADFAKAVKAFELRGESWLDRGDYDRAIADFGTALSLDPNMADALLHRGVAYKLKGMPERAVADYDRCLQQNPNDSLAWMNRGNARKSMGQPELAFADYAKALELDPKNPDIPFNVGMLHLEQGDYAAAIASFTHVVRLNPGDWAAYARRGEAKERSGKPTAANADYAKADQLRKGGGEAGKVGVE